MAELRAGEVFYLTGILATARDRVHERVVVAGAMPPVSLENLAVMHAGPIVVEKGGVLVCTSLGPTTSARFEKLIGRFVEATGAKIVIGKGGVSGETARKLREFGAIYAVYPGGCGALGALAVEEVVGVYWEDLGPAEALWLLRVRELGPLVVTVDLEGVNLTEGVEASARLSLESLMGASGRRRERLEL